MRLAEYVGRGQAYCDCDCHYWEDGNVLKEWEEWRDIHGQTFAG